MIDPCSEGFLFEGVANFLTKGGKKTLLGPPTSLTLKITRKTVAFLKGNARVVEKVTPHLKPLIALPIMETPW